MTDELKPCPFCGGPARMDIGKMVFVDAEISCEQCGTCGPNIDGDIGQSDNERIAIAAWNTRAQSPSSTPAVDQVEAVARIINPTDFKSYAGLIEHCIAQGDSPETAKRYADNSYGKGMEAARETARAAIAAMPLRPDTGMREALEARDVLIAEMIAKARLAAAGGDHGGWWRRFAEEAEAARLALAGVPEGIEGLGLGSGASSCGEPK